MTDKTSKLNLEDIPTTCLDFSFPIQIKIHMISLCLDFSDPGVTDLYYSHLAPVSLSRSILHAPGLNSWDKADPSSDQAISTPGRSLSSECRGRGRCDDI